MRLDNFSIYSTQGYMRGSAWTSGQLVMTGRPEVQPKADEACPAIPHPGAGWEDFAASADGDHPETLRLRNNLAAAYFAAGDTAKAVAMFEAVLRQRESR